MNKDIPIARAMQKLIDSNYAIDNPVRGWDCLNSLMTFYRELGVKFPEEFEGWTLENYGRRALADPEAAHEQFEKFALTLGREINPSYLIAGDLLLIKLQDDRIYAGVYLGNGSAFFMFNVGGRVVPWPSLPLVSARRLIE